MIKRRRFLIQQGLICTIDPFNLTKQYTNGLVSVVVLRRVKWIPFGRSIWEVANAEHPDDGITLECPEYLLYPNGMFIIRNPPTLPRFNNLDLSTIEIVIKAVDVIQEQEPNDNVSKQLKRLKSIREKIKLSISLTEV